MNQEDRVAMNRRQFAGVGIGAAAFATTGGPALAASRPGADQDSFVAPPAPPAQAPVEESYVEVADSVRLWCWDTGGTGAPVVLFHPATGSGKVWSYQQPVFAKAGYRVIGYSRRGYANSDNGPSTSPGTTSGDLRALLDKLKIDRFHAVATAGGGFVAADYAISHPGKLISLTLACSILGVEDGEIGAMNKRIRPDFFNKIPADYREIGPSYRATNPEGHAAWVALNAGGRSPGAVSQPQANTITLDALRRFTTPTLLLCGDADLLSPPPVARAFAKAMPNARLEILTECGHSAYWERPEQFNKLVLDFIRSHKA